MNAVLVANTHALPHTHPQFEMCMCRRGTYRRRKRSYIVLPVHSCKMGVMV